MSASAIDELVARGESDELTFERGRVYLATLQLFLATFFAELRGGRVQRCTDPWMTADKLGTTLYLPARLVLYAEACDIEQAFIRFGPRICWEIGYGGG